MIESKSDIRKRIRDLRRTLSTRDQLDGASGLLQQLCLLPEFSMAQRVALYLANDGEIDPINVIHHCWQTDKETYVPVIIPGAGNVLKFALISQKTQYTQNRFGIKEPVVKSDELRDAKDLDLVLVPLVAFDESGNRVGMGGGFYDTTFEFVGNINTSSPVLVGVAHEIQKVDVVVAEHWDIALTTVVTGHHTYRISSGCGR